MQLGHTIRNLLEIKGLSQKQLSDMTHISYKTLNGYLNDIRQPDLDTLVTIADVLEVTVDYLLGHSATTECTANNKERDVLKHFRMLTKEQQELIQIELRFMREQNMRTKTKLSATTSKSDTDTKIG